MRKLRYNIVFRLFQNTLFPEVGERVIFIANLKNQPLFEISSDVGMYHLIPAVKMATVNYAAIINCVCKV